MRNKRKKRLHISHSDLDGCIPFLLDSYFGEVFDYSMSMNYHDFEKEDFNYEIFRKYDEIIFSDFSPNQKALDIMIESNVHLVVVDHHASFYELFQNNIEKLESLPRKGLIEIHFDNTKSGSGLYFDYLKEKHNKYRVSKVLSEIVTLADTYDLFKTESPLWEQALSLNRMLWKSYNWGFKDSLDIRKFSKFLKMLQDKVDNLNSFQYNSYEQNAIRETVARELDAYKKAMSNILIRVDSKGNTFGLVRMRAKVSIVAHTILKNYPKFDYLLIINEYNKDDLKMSGRSKGFNLLQLNYLRGHSQASGSEPLEEGFLEKLWQGREVYELGYREDFVEAEDEELEVIHSIF